MVKTYTLRKFTVKEIIIFLFLLSMSLPIFSQSKMGVNLVNDMAFVNLIDEGARFDNVTSYDDQGWPRSNFKAIFDWRLATEWAGSVDDPEAYRIKMSGIYKASFIGQADISIMGAALSNKVYDASTNTTTFDITVPTHNNGKVYWDLNFTNTKRTSSSATNTGITKLKILRPGYALNTSQVFTNDYINLCKSASFGCYRYYNVNNVWDGVPTYPATTTWNNRKLPTDATQTNMLNINGKSEGWCWEHIIQMANIFKKDIWINIHVSADDNYVTNLATKLKNELDPAINIYVELGNEVWSPTWHVQDKWLDDQAKAQGISFIDNYAKNVVRLSNLFKNVYGATAINSKIRVVLGAQQGWVGRSEMHLNYIKNNLGDPKTFVYALAPATYFDGKGATIEESLNECHTEIMKEYDDPNDDPSLAKFMRIAKTWGLPGVCVSYEGQEHGVIGETSNLPVKIGIHRDPRMATEQYFNFKSFFDNGGTLACQFGLWATYSRYGCWGLTDDPSNPDRNFKFKAARSLCGDANGMPVPAVPGTPSGLTSSNVSTSQIALKWTDNASNEDGYEVWFKESTATIWKYYSTVGPNKTSENFTIPADGAGKTYNFRVRAYNFSQWSGFNYEGQQPTPTPTVLRTPENPSNAVAGIDYSYFEGSWDLLPNFNSLTPIKKGNASNFDLTARNTNDNFGFQFIGYINVPSDGNYTFYTASDDGSKLFIGTTEVVNNDGLHGEVEKSGTIGLKTGMHAITVAFFEKGGGEVLKVSYSGPNIAKTLIPSSALFRVSSTSITPIPSVLKDPENPTNTVSGIDYSYYEGSWDLLPNFNSLTPIKKGNVSNFDLSVRNLNDYFGFRFTGYINIPVDGNYTFYTSSDDGSKLFIGTIEILNNDGLHAAVEKSGTIGLKAGKHAITVVYFEKTGGEVLDVSYSGPNFAKTLIPSSSLFRISTSGAGGGLRAEYFNNIYLTSPASLSKTDATINFDWGTAAPASGINADYYSVRWTGQVEAPVSGTYTFSTTSDDGVRLWVNGVQVVNNWTDHAPTTNNGTSITLTEGQKYDIRMEYYEKTGGAVAKLLWAYPGQTQQVVPQNRLYSSSSNLREDDSFVMNNITVAPNPASEAIYVMVPYEGEEVSITLCNSIGEIFLQKTEVVTQSLNVDLSNITPGMYFLTVKKGNLKHVEKVFVTK